jgi:hypothetical protein
MTDDLCVCGPMTRAQNYCDCGAEESAAELRYGGGVCDDEATGLATLDRPYFDLDGNESTYGEVYSA